MAKRYIVSVSRKGVFVGASAYRTVSEPASMVIAGVIPVANLAKKRKAIYMRTGEEIREVVARK